MEKIVKWFKKHRDDFEWLGMVIMLLSVCGGLIYACIKVIDILLNLNPNK